MAESINGLALRSSINFGMPALSCPGVLSIFEEGHTAKVDFRLGIVENLTTGRSLTCQALPDVLADLAIDGGIVQMLVKKELIEPNPAIVGSK